MTESDPITLLNLATEFIPKINIAKTLGDLNQVAEEVNKHPPGPNRDTCKALLEKRQLDLARRDLEPKINDAKTLEELSQVEAELNKHLQGSNHELFKGILERCRLEMECQLRIEFVPRI